MRLNGAFCQNRRKAKAKYMNAVFIAPILWFALTTALDDGPYFPVKTKAGEEGVMPRAAEWYGKSLERMKEPKLPSLAKDVNTVVYRQSFTLRQQTYSDLRPVCSHRQMAT